MTDTKLTAFRLDHALARPLIALGLRLWFRFYGRWKVVDIENIPRTGPVIFAANHASNLDPFLGWAAITPARRMWGVAKIELWEHPLSRYLMSCIGAVPVKRGTADRTMIRRVLDLLAANETIGIFPEGTRTHDGKLQPAQAGLALLQQKSGAPIVPVAMLGTYEMLPRGGKMRRVPLTVAFGKPMQFEPNCPREQILTSVMAALAELMTANGQPTDPPTLPAAALKE